MSPPITALYCGLADLAETLEDREAHRLTPSTRRRRQGKLSLGEMVFVMVLPHLSPINDFNHFWLYGVQQKERDGFEERPGSARFGALMPRLFAPFCVLLHNLSGKQTGIYIVDSTRLAARGRSSMGWFCGFKLPVVMKRAGELMAVPPRTTPMTAPLADMVAGLEGRLLVDKGYISKKRVARLWDQGLHLLTGIRRNRKDCLRPIMDKLLLRKRFIVDTLFEKLTSEMGLEHTRHRSPTKAFVRILSCLVACTLGKNKVRVKDYRLTPVASFRGM